MLRLLRAHRSNLGLGDTGFQKAGDDPCGDRRAGRRGRLSGCPRDRSAAAQGLPELILALELELIAQDVMPESRIPDLVVAMRRLRAEDSAVRKKSAIAEVISGATTRSASRLPAVDLTEPTEVAPTRLRHYASMGTRGSAKRTAGRLPAASATKARSTYGK